ncbi:hypothetical protein ACFYZN_32920 [Streptomyces sp. NPDC001777]|uniref:hypothetical protein n=1 Tax=Streptomyces sp. NPDC001777 TaxID=3364608 RepID=UPI00367DC879
MLVFDHVGMPTAGTRVPAGGTGPAKTADAWNHRLGGDGADAGLTFACRFLPLPLERPLADEQDA